MRTVLVTGGAGFVGAHVAAALAERGDRLVLLDLQPPRPGGEPEHILKSVPRERLAFVQGDVADLSALAHAIRSHQVTHLVHAAAMNQVPVLRERPLQVMRVNVGGSVNTLECARIFGLQRVVLTSSIAVYAPRQYEPIDEAHPTILPGVGPTLLSYSASKQAAEAFALHYWADHDVDCVILRLSAIYGLGMYYPMYIKPMVEGAVCGEPVHFAAGGDSCRDYTHVHDVAAAILLALDAPDDRLVSRIYNVSTGEPLVSASRVAELVREQVPGAEIRIGPGVPEEEIPTVTTRGVLSIARARAELGFSPRFDMTAGIAEYVTAYRTFRAARL